MKVQVQEKPRLEDGRHVVTITQIEEGRSEYKDVPFFQARMENDEGFVESRFYDSEPSQPILAELMEAVGLKGETLDTEKLKGKTLSVEVHERTYPDPQTGVDKTIKETRNYKVAGEAETSKQPRG